MGLRGIRGNYVFGGSAVFNNEWNDNPVFFNNGLNEWNENWLLEGMNAGGKKRQSACSMVGSMRLG